MPCLKLALGSTRKVRRAVIPAAGFGTRLFPASKAMKKELFPIIDGDGRAKPVIMAIIEEVIQAGIEEICLLFRKTTRPFSKIFFVAPRDRRTLINSRRRAGNTSIILSNSGI